MGPRSQQGDSALPTKETASHRRHLLFSLCGKSSPQEAVKTVQRCHEPSPGLAQRRHLTGLRSTVQTSASWQNAVHQTDSQGAAVGTRGSVPQHWPGVRHVMQNGSIITKDSSTARLVTPITYLSLAHFVPHVILRTSHKRNRTVCDLLRWSFSLSILASDPLRLLCSSPS